jgi:hypothetical protein
VLPLSTWTVSAPNPRNNFRRPAYGDWANRGHQPGQQLLPGCAPGLGAVQDPHVRLAQQPPRDKRQRQTALATLSRHADDGVAKSRATTPALEGDTEHPALPWKQPSPNAFATAATWRA